MRISDWSSDVCSSDLLVLAHQDLTAGGVGGVDLAVGQDDGVEVSVAAKGHGLPRPGGVVGPHQPERRWRVLTEIGVPAGEEAVVPADDEAHRVLDRKSVGSGKCVAVRVDFCGRRVIKKKKKR